MSSPADIRTQVFISYSHRDKRHLDQLLVHLAPDEREGRLNVWADTKILAGQDWREEIRQALASARVAIVLVSAHFRASQFIADNELPPLLLAAKHEGVVIIPVVVGACDFHDSELANVQAVNDPFKPLDGMTRHQRDKVWVRVVKQVRNASSSTAQQPQQAPQAAPKLPLEQPAALSLNRREILGNAIHANMEKRYDDAVDVLKPLTQADDFDFLAWFEYAFAWAHIDSELAVVAFMRAYNNADPRRTVLGINDVKFPAGYFRYSVFTGTGNGTVEHTIGERPDGLYFVSGTGKHFSIHAMPAPNTVPSALFAADDQVVRVTGAEMAYERWICVASKRTEMEDAEFDLTVQRVHRKASLMFGDP